MSQVFDKTAKPAHLPGLQNSAEISYEILLSSWGYLHFFFFSYKLYSCLAWLVYHE